MRSEEPSRMTYDASPGQELSEGDVLRTITGKCRRVLEARKMSSAHPNRWALLAIPIEAPEEGDRVHSLRWHPRKRKVKRT